MASIAAQMVPATLTPLVVTNASTTVPKQLSVTSIKFRSATFFGYKAAQTLNTGTVYLGTSSSDGGPGIPIVPGAGVEVTAPSGECYDLANFYLDCVTANDGLLVEYT